MFIQGSPKWFWQKSLSEDAQKVYRDSVYIRKKFRELFSPDKLREMDGRQLLDLVFDNTVQEHPLIDGGNSCNECMCEWLISDWKFGTCGRKYTYLLPLYKKKNETKWKKRIPGNKTEYINAVDALTEAEKIRDQIIICVDKLKQIGSFSKVDDYVTFGKLTSNIYFAQYPWMLKYYQMLYPEYFPCIYVDQVLERALYILGLPKHGSRLKKSGQLSLFIRDCEIDCNVFSKVYADEWGWEEFREPCESANFNGNGSLIHSGIRAKAVEQIETETKCLLREGIERESYVKTRVNQSYFRGDLLKSQQKCCLCGVCNEEILIASHIKPWSVSESNEKLDPDNGLLLCANHDRLFDRGLISFDDTGKIIISEKLSDEDRLLLNINSNMYITLNENRKRFLEFHRKNIFKA